MATSHQLLLQRMQQHRNVRVLLRQPVLSESYSAVKNQISDFSPQQAVQPVNQNNGSPAKGNGQLAMGSAEQPISRLPNQPVAQPANQNNGPQITDDVQLAMRSAEQHVARPANQLAAQPANLNDAPQAADRVQRTTASTEAAGTIGTPPDSTIGESTWNRLSRVMQGHQAILEENDGVQPMPNVSAPSFMTPQQQTESVQRRKNIKASKEAYRKAAAKPDPSKQRPVQRRASLEVVSSSDQPSVNRRQLSSVESQEPAVRPAPVSSQTASEPIARTHMSLGEIDFDGQVEDAVESQTNDQLSMDSVSSVDLPTSAQRTPLTDSSSVQRAMVDAPNPERQSPTFDGDGDRVQSLMRDVASEQHSNSPVETLPPPPRPNFAKPVRRKVATNKLHRELPAGQRRSADLPNSPAASGSSAQIAREEMVESQTPPVANDMVQTEIGDLPSDLWSLMDESPPAADVANLNQGAPTGASSANVQRVAVKENNDWAANEPASTVAEPLRYAEQPVLPMNNPGNQMARVVHAENSTIPFDQTALDEAIGQSASLLVPPASPTSPTSIGPSPSLARRAHTTERPNEMGNMQIASQSDMSRSAESKSVLNEPKPVQTGLVTAKPMAAVTPDVSREIASDSATAGRSDAVPSFSEPTLAPNQINSVVQAKLNNQAVTSPQIHRQTSEVTSGSVQSQVSAQPQQPRGNVQRATVPQSEGHPTSNGPRVTHHIQRAEDEDEQGEEPAEEFESDDGTGFMDTVNTQLKQSRDRHHDQQSLLGRDITMYSTPYEAEKNLDKPLPVLAKQKENKTGFQMYAERESFQRLGRNTVEATKKILSRQKMRMTKRKKTISTSISCRVRSIKNYAADCLENGNSGGRDCRDLRLTILN